MLRSSKLSLKVYYLFQMVKNYSKRTMTSLEIVDKHLYHKKLEFKQKTALKMPHVVKKTSLAKRIFFIPTFVALSQNMA